jgi:EmrB/QacA subfamily drug resistance transporter
MNGSNDRAYTATEKNIVLFVATLSSFFIPFMTSSVNIALPSIGKEFALDAVWLSWVFTAFLLSSVILLLPFGKISDIYGRKKAFNYGMIVFTLASLASGLSGSAVVFIAFRVLQGVGGSLIFVNGVAMITSVYPARERGKALGINIAAVYLGMSLGPVLGGLLTQYLGWRSIFLVCVPLGVIVVVVIFWKLRVEWSEAKAGKFDFLGSVICGLAIIALMLGFSTLPALLGILLILAGVSGSLVFIWRERRAEDPILQIGLFRKNPVYLFSNFAALLNYSSTFSVMFLMSLYLQYAKGLIPLHAGVILIAMPAVQAAFSPLAGRLSDRIGPRILASLGMGLTTASLVLFAFVDKNTGMGYLLAGLIVMGLGIALFISPNTNAIMGSVESRYYGVASATLTTMRQVGIMISMGIATSMFAILIGRVEITPEYYPAFIQSLRFIFPVAAVICSGGIFLSLAGGSKK